MYAIVNGVRYIPIDTKKLVIDDQEYTPDLSQSNFIVINGINYIKEDFEKETIINGIKYIKSTKSPDSIIFHVTTNCVNSVELKGKNILEIKKELNKLCRGSKWISVGPVYFYKNGKEIRKVDGVACSATNNFEHWENFMEEWIELFLKYL